MQIENNFSFKCPKKFAIKDVTKSWFKKFAIMVLIDFRTTKAVLRWQPSCSTGGEIFPLTWSLQQIDMLVSIFTSLTMAMSYC